MRISSAIHDVFGHFQNLNLLALLNDLRDGNSTRRHWASGSQLCPVAHGLPGGQEVRQLCVMGQSADLEKGCEYAARRLGADPATVYRFVRSWDDNVVSRQWLLKLLEAMWKERLDDAVAVQKIISAPLCVLRG